MSRASRLQSGRHWLRSFPGKRVVSSYARWFGVDLKCAAKELQILGVRLAPGYLEALQRTVSERPRHRRDSAKQASALDIEPISNREFAYIAGYTGAGLPFGLSWEELEAVEGDPPLTEDDLGPHSF